MCDIFLVDISFSQTNKRGMGKYVSKMIDMLKNSGVNVKTHCNGLIIGSLKFRIPHYLYEQIVVCIKHWFFRKENFVFPYNTAPFLIKPKKGDIYVVHDLIFFNSKPTSIRENLIKWYYIFNVSFNIRRFKKIITVSETSKKMLVERFSVSSERITVVYNSFEVKTMSSLKREKYIFHVGGWTWNKNTNNMINGFRDSDYYSTHRLVILGIQEYKLEDSRVEILGRLSEKELEKYYRCADFFVFPSREEGFGRPLIEALIYNTPVLCNDIPVFREIGSRFVTYADMSTADKISLALNNYSKNKEVFNLKNSPFTYEKVQAELLNIIKA